MDQSLALPGCHTARGATAAALQSLGWARRSPLCDRLLRRHDRWLAGAPVSALLYRNSRECLLRLVEPRYRRTPRWADRSRAVCSLGAVRCFEPLFSYSYHQASAGRTTALDVPARYLPGDQGSVHLALSADALSLYDGAHRRRYRHRDVQADVLRVSHG